jgi:hypothetical protein
MSASIDADCAGVRRPWQAAGLMALAAACGLAPPAARPQVQTPQGAKAGAPTSRAIPRSSPW